MILSWIAAALSRMVSYGTPLLLGTLGEIYAERSGVLNLGVEGMMILGAVSAFATAYTTGNPWLALLAAAAAGGLSSLIHGFFSISLRANQVISGLALTMFGLGLSGLFGKGFAGLPLDNPLPKVTVPLLAEVPLLGTALFQDKSPLIYLGILLTPVLWFLLFRTSLGVNIRSVGENPAAADAAGLNVWRIRYGCVFFGGVMAGLAGGFLSVAYRPAWTQGMTSGMGWIVVALTIFASWNPTRGLFGAYFFGLLFYLSYRLQPWLAPEILQMAPYLGAVLALVLINLFQKRKGGPEALMEPYKRGEK